MLPYFQTDNTALANALALCGCKPPVDDRGQPIPQIMLYDAETLRRMGYSGLTADEGAKRAMKERRPGVRVFQFQRTEDLERIVTAFSKAHAEMEAGENIVADTVDFEDVAAICYAVNRMRRKMLSSFDIPAFIGSYHGADGTKTETGYKSSGKFSAISVGASDKLKAEVRG